MTTLVFLTLLFVAGVIAWLVDFPHWDTPLAVAGAVIAGLGCGFFLAAWTPAQASVTDVAVVKATVMGNWSRLPAEQQQTVCRRWAAHPNGKFVRRTSRLATGIADGISPREARRGVRAALGQVCR